ncbi:MAG: short-chain-fatty-acid--CoA ligase, partial [Comamonadaceae bacterium]
MILVPQDKIADYVARGWWGEVTLAHLFIATARRQPQAPAVADPPNLAQITGGTPKRWSWGELLREVGRAAAFLHAQGLRKDDVLVVQLPNCVELHALYLACAASGIVISPLPVQYRGHELAHVVAMTGAKMAITTARVGSYRSAHQWAAQFTGALAIWA